MAVVRNIDSTLMGDSAFFSNDQPGTVYVKRRVHICTITIETFPRASPNAHGVIEWPLMYRVAGPFVSNSVQSRMR